MVYYALTVGSDVIVGSSGDDTFGSLYGPYGGADNISGGYGNDEFYIRSDSGKFYGQYGNDLFTIFAENASYIDGGSGTDTLYAHYTSISKNTIKDVEILDTTDITLTLSQAKAFSKITTSDDTISRISLSLVGAGGTIDFSSKISGGDKIEIYGANLKSSLNLIGSANDDIITGTQFKDTLNGGGGNDIFVVTNGTDIIDGGSGKDIIQSEYGNLSKMTLKNVETLDGGNITATINQINMFTTIYNSQESGDGEIAISISGPGGNLNLSKKLAIDTTVNITAASSTSAVSITGGNGNDTIIGSKFNDTLNGGNGNDIFLNNNGSDKIDGGAGIDSLIIGDYDISNFTINNIEILDTYKVTLKSDQIGKFSSIQNNYGTDEQIYIYLKGNGGTIDFNKKIGTENSIHLDASSAKSAMSISGSMNDDTIIGSKFNDIINGGNGDDTFIVSNGSDIINGGNGNDTIQAEIQSITKLTIKNVEILSALDVTATIQQINSFSSIKAIYPDQDNIYISLQGSGGNINLSNKAVDNIGISLDGAKLTSAAVITGTSNNDEIIGTKFNDTLQGGLGADTIDGGDGIDTISYNNSKSSITVNLSTGTSKDGDTISNVENVIGSTFSDQIIGDDGNNRINGSIGNDILRGGKGFDYLIGGDGKDIFDFNSLSDSSPTSRDTIADFTHGSDKIDLSGIDANSKVAGNQSFSFIGSAGFDGHAGEVRYAGGHIYADVNGDKIADLDIVMLNNAKISAGDFVL